MAPAAATVYRAAPVRAARPAPPVVIALRRFPNPRLTGLGGGIFGAAVMFLLGCLDSLLFDGGPLMYGLLFLPVAALIALWVRPADLVTAPISVPISFAFGSLPIAGGTGGAAWPHRRPDHDTRAESPAGCTAGRSSAGVIATVRKIRMIRRRYR